MNHSRKEGSAYQWTRLFSLFEPRFDWIQVEVTSDCQAACCYCPRTAYRDHWQNRYLSLESFKRLQPTFALSRMVHLQGWGEPFLHPEFFTMTAIARAAGCRVGTTTNGMLLNPERITRLVASELDVVAFSLAGVDFHNDSIRRGTRLEQILETIRTLNRKKKRVNSLKPAIHVAYMLFRSRMKDLDLLTSLLQGLGISQVVISTLDFVAQPELELETIQPTTEGEYKELKNILQGVVLTGAQSGLPIHFNLPPFLGKRQECTENIRRAVCVASDGSVTPCVFTNLMIPGGKFLRQGNERPYDRLVFGNINHELLRNIWRKKDYSRFRRSFKRGNLAPPCRGCPKL